MVAGEGRSVCECLSRLGQVDETSNHPRLWERVNQWTIRSENVPFLVPVLLATLEVTQHPD